MPALVILVCLVVFAAGAVITVRAIGTIWHCRLASRWPTATATLLEVEDQDISGPEDTNHRIRVLFTYVVHGVRHEGKTVHPCYVGGSRFSKGHLDLLELLQPGHQYRVRYNPRRHEDSTLSASFQFGSIFPLLMGIELILFAAALMAQFGAGSTLGRPLFILCGFNLVLMLVVLLMGRGFTLSGITRIPG